MTSKPPKLKELLKKIMTGAATYKTWLQLEEVVASFCETDTDGLEDWLQSGQYEGTETARDIADEWDKLTRQAKNEA